MLIFFCISSKSIEDWCAFRLWHFLRIQSTVVRGVCSNCFIEKRAIRDLFHYSMRVGKAVWMNTAYYTKRGFTNYGIKLAANEREIYNRFYNREWNAKYSHCFDSIWFQFNSIYVIAFADGGSFVVDFFSSLLTFVCENGGFIFICSVLITPKGCYRVKYTVNRTEPNRTKPTRTEPTSFIQHLLLLLYNVVVTPYLVLLKFCYQLADAFFSLRKLMRIIKRR